MKKKTYRVFAVGKRGCITDDDKQFIHCQSLALWKFYFLIHVLPFNKSRDRVVYFSELVFISFLNIGGGNGNPLQCSCLENPRDGGAWWTAVCGVAQSRTRLTRLSSSSSSFLNGDFYSQRGRGPGPRFVAGAPAWLPTQGSSVTAD